MQRVIILALALIFVPNAIFAESVTADDCSFLCNLNEQFAYVIGQMQSVLFYEVKIFGGENSLGEPKQGIPFLVLWLIIGGIFFTFRLGLVNIRLFGHALAVVRGKYSKSNDPGQITHSQALTSAISATVGLGNISGVAIAVAAGGPGAVIWMVIAAFFGMTTKFAEVTLGVKYRKIDADGNVSGGPFHYLKDGLKNKGMGLLGVILAGAFAVCCFFGALGGANMYQSNQTVAIFTDTFPVLGEYKVYLSLLLSVCVGLVLIGGIKRIAAVAGAVVPFMGLVYFTAAIAVILYNIESLSSALNIMFTQAFDFEAMWGGALGALVMGFQRSVFSNEAGVGSSSIAHSAAKTSEPIREGAVAILEPFIDTVIVCFLTGIVITISGVYTLQFGPEEERVGVLLTSAAFATVIDWFPVVLSFCIAMFAFSTMITWSYYGEKSWNYLFGSSSIIIYRLIFCFATFMGGIMHLKLVIDFSDTIFFAMGLINLLGLYLLSGEVAQDLKIYIKKLKSGAFKKS